MNETETIGGRGTERKMKILEETKADLIIHSSEL